MKINKRVLNVRLKARQALKILTAWALKISRPLRSVVLLVKATIPLAQTKNLNMLY